MNPSPSGVLGLVVPGSKYAVMLLTVSVLTELVVFPFDVEEQLCNPNPGKNAEPTTIQNIVRLMFIVNH